MTWYTLGTQPPLTNWDALPSMVGNGKWETLDFAFKQRDNPYNIFLPPISGSMTCRVSQNVQKTPLSCQFDGERIENNIS